MKARHLKSCRQAMRVLAAILLVCAFFPSLVKAGIPEKYGEKCTTSDRKRYYLVKFSVKNNPVKKNNQILPESEYTYIKYYLDGTVEWDWFGEFAEGWISGVKGTRIDDNGSFKLKRSDVIGHIEPYSPLGSLWRNANINLFPMIQFDGMNILITDWNDIIFRVGEDEQIRMECNKENIPSEAKIGFGPIYTNYVLSDHSEYNNNYKVTKYDYGPEWQMLLDFSMKPLYPNQNAIHEIIDDAAEADTPIYDIFGKRMEADKNSLTPGIYIYKGQKILVK